MQGILCREFYAYFVYKNYLENVLKTKLSLIDLSLFSLLFSTVLLVFFSLEKIITWHLHAFIYFCLII